MHGHQGRNPRPFLIGQVTRIPLGLLLDLGHSAAARWVHIHSLNHGRASSAIPASPIFKTDSERNTGHQSGRS